MMKSKEGKKKKEKLSSKKVPEEISGLEEELEKRKSVDAGEEPELEFNFNGIDFNAELAHILSFQRAPRPENKVELKEDLESFAFFAPRPRADKPRKLDYSGTGYEADLYKEGNDKYENKTPFYTSGSQAPGGESGMGRSFESRSRRGSENGANGTGSEAA